MKLYIFSLVCMVSGYLDAMNNLPVHVTNSIRAHQQHNLQQQSQKDTNARFNTLFQNQNNESKHHTKNITHCLHDNNQANKEGECIIN